MQNNKKILTTEKAFTLLELLLVIAVIAVLAGIILFALNPAQRLEDANNAQTMAKSEDIRKAIEAYAIANGGSMPTNIASLTTYGLHDICKAGQSTNCLNLDQLVTDGYLGSIPEDKDGSTTVISGYKLEYNPAKNNVQVYNTDSFTEYVEDGATLTTGLVGYWKMDEAGWTNNCSTGTVMDSSGNNNHGRACPNSTGPTGASSGRYGLGGDFDGSNDYVTISDNAALQLTTHGTVEAWIYPESYPTSGNWKVIVNKGGWGAGTNDFGMYFQSTNNICYISSGVTAGQNRCVSNTYTPLNTWSHVVLVWDLTTYRLYINGTQVDQGAKTIHPNTAGYNLEFGHNASGYLFDGKIDNIRMYNRALSTYEITAMYNYAPAAIAHWKFDDASGTSAQDASGNGNSGILTSGPVWTGGMYNGAVNFPAATSRVAITDIPNSPLDIYQLTMSAWTNRSAAPSSQSRIINKGDTYALYFQTPNTLICYTANLSPGSVSYTLPTLNKWVHIACTISNNTKTLYVDGVNVASGSFTGTIPFNDNELTIGNYVSAGSTYWFNGSIDDVRIYNYPMTQIQIQKVMNNQI